MKKLLFTCLSLLLLLNVYAHNNWVSSARLGTRDTSKHTITAPFKVSREHSWYSNKGLLNLYAAQHALRLNVQGPECAYTSAVVTCLDDVSYNMVKAKGGFVVESSGNVAQGIASSSNFEAKVYPGLLDGHISVQVYAEYKGERLPVGEPSLETLLVPPSPIANKNQLDASFVIESPVIKATNGVETPIQVVADGTDITRFRISRKSLSTCPLPLTNISLLKLRISDSQKNTYSPDQIGSLTFLSATEGEVWYSYTSPKHKSEVSPGEIFLELYTDCDLNKSTVGKFTIKISNPPLLLLHGMCDNAAIWTPLITTLTANSYITSSLIYAPSYPNTASFNSNYPLVANYIDELLRKSITSEKTSAGKVDIIGHSMGGILARLYQQSVLYGNNVNKIITCNTPHSGSQQANIRKKNPILPKLLGGSTCALDLNNEAANNLEIGSAQIESLNANRHNHRDIPVHSIASTWQFASSPGCFVPTQTVYGVPSNSLTYWSFIIGCTKIDNDFLSTIVFKEAHDGVVSLSSQIGGVQSSATTTISNQFHSNSVASSAMITTLQSLLKADGSSSLFSRQGFNPPTLTAAPATGGNTFINIDATLRGKIVERGTQLSIKVAASTDIQRVSLMVLSSSTDSVLVAHDDTAPFEFSAKLLRAFKGKVEIHALYRTADDLISDSLSFEAQDSFPEVQTIAVDSIASTQASIRAAVLTTGLSPVTQRGIVWGVAPNPSLESSNVIVNELGVGTFTTLLRSLQPGLTHYVRAYATNSHGTAYGDQILFKTLDCRTNDSLELVKLYYATNGANWTQKWDLNAPVSTWRGVTRTAEGCVTKIDLSSNGLSGKIPDFKLPNLQYLYLANNKLTDTIPNFNLPNLEWLELHFNQLTGVIPNFNLPNLQVLYLSSNQLTGTIPNFNLPNLLDLQLTNNQLTGTIPNFNLPNLQTLGLTYNQLTGSIPNFNLPNLRQLGLGSNQLSGTIPNFNLPDLIYLDLWSNQLTGSIPNFNLPNLRELGLGSNQLSGTIPNFNLPDLIYLDLWSNQLTGSIPNFNLPDLQELNLWGNQLTGSIPNFNLPNLQRLDLGSNQLIGIVPDFNLPNLFNLFLNNNQLTGSIPNFNLPDLQELWLNNNQLTGTIPNFNLPNLKYLWLQYNRLTGTIPNFNLPNLQDLLLGDNQLTGTIPNFNLPNLFNLFLNNNQLTGNIPNFNLPNLLYLFLNNNQLTGTIPNLKLSNLYYVNFSNNQLSGRVPGFEGSPALSLLRLDNNELTELPVMVLAPSSPRLDSLYKEAVFGITDKDHHALRGSPQLDTLPGSITTGGTLSITLNRLTFDDLLPNLPLAASRQYNFYYIPQKKIYPDTTFEVLPGAAFTLDLGIDTALTDNIYYWEKDGAPFDTLVGDNRLVLEAVGDADYGSYVVRVQQAGVPGLTLQSGVIQLLPAVENCRTNDSLELVKLYYATNGANWDTQWDLSTPVDTWHGVARTAEGCVTRISLYSNGLSGSIPNFNLPNLQLLDLDANQLTGSIPNFNLPNLQGLDIGSNQLTGIIPNFNLPKLQELWLQNNQLTGSIPNLNLPNLQWLSLGGNQLTGSIPNLNLPNLQYLSLSANQLTGNIPNFNLPNLQLLWLPYNQLTDTIPNFNLPNLQELYLSGNQLTGNIPNFNLPNLRKLWLPYNQLTDTIPNFNLPKLQSLWLNKNQLTGSIPNFNLPNLLSLDLGGNQLTGIIPNFNLPNLEDLHLYYNQLTDTIPNFNLPNLLILDLGGNQLTGIIPNFNLPNLFELWLDNNQLTGTIPNLKLSNLYYINFSNNQLSGRVPGFEESPSLSELRLDNNELTELPVMTLAPSSPRLDSLYKEAVYGITDKEYHTLRGSPQLDTLPGSITTGGTLSVTFNRLTFDDLLPNVTLAASRQYNFYYTPQKKIYPDTTFEVLPGATFTLDLGIDTALTDNIYYWEKDGAPFDSLVGDNRLVLEAVGDADYGSYVVRVQQAGVPGLTLESGVIQLLPAEENCRTNDSLELVKLYYATNGANWYTKWDLSTPVDTWRGVTRNTEGCVTRIDLYSNALTGTIPDFNLPNLRELGLGSNQLTGSIPDFNLPNLLSLQLSYNQLSGSIPNLNLPNLRNLTLSNNQLTGSIPNLNLPNLQELYLSDNQLTGSIPDFNLPNLRKLWLPYNQLTDTIPNFNLPNLQELYLYNNQLTGSIPNFNLPNLQSLLLYNNQLTGSIPDFNLPNLRKLWLPYNQLTDTIPNFNLPNLQELYLYNNQLTGSIPNFNLPNLLSLDLYNNQLTDTIPNFNLPNLLSLDLYNNQLTGSIPNFDIPNLQYLYLSDNQLTGTIPNFNLPNLQWLWLGGNQLTGSIPNLNLPNLQYLSLGRNQLTGTIPNLNLPILQYLFLENNQLTGSIPDLKLSNLYYVNFSNNQLSGRVPGFEESQYLSQLRLDNNELTELPDLVLAPSSPRLDSLYKVAAYGITDKEYHTLRGSPQLDTLPGSITTGGTLSVAFNRLTFDDVIPNIGLLEEGIFNYVPQEAIFTDTVLVVSPGDSLVFDLGIDADVADNTYSWTKDGEPYRTVVGDNRLLLDAIRSSDSGVYSVEVRNARVPDLVLYGGNLHVEVDCPDNPMAHLKSQSDTICLGAEYLFWVDLGNDRQLWNIRYSIDEVEYEVSDYASGTLLRANLSADAELKLLYVSLENGCEAPIGDDLLSVRVQRFSGVLGADQSVICIGGTANLNVTGVLPGSRITWERSLDSLLWQDIAGATASTLRLTGAEEGLIYYRVRVQQGRCTFATNALTIDVKDGLEIPVITGPGKLCVGDSIDLYAGEYFGYPKVSYRWQTSLNNSTFTDIAGNSGEWLRVTRGAAGITYYRVSVSTSGSGCATKTSPNHTLTAVARPGITVSTGQTEVCVGSGIGLSGSFAPLTAGSYQWQESPDSLEWTDIKGAVSSSYTVVRQEAGMRYYRLVGLVADAECAIISQGYRLSWITQPQVALVYGDTAVCSGGKLLIKAQAIGTSTASYVWQTSTNRTTWTTITGATQGSYSATGGTVGSVQYHRVQMNPGKTGCGVVTSEIVGLRVVGKLSVVLEADTGLVCTGGKVVLRVRSQGGVGQSRYVWQQSQNRQTWLGLGAGTDSTLNISGTTGVYYYRAIVSSSGTGCGTNISSNQVSVNGVSKATLGLRADAEKVCESGEVRLNATWGNGVAGGYYVWERSMDGTFWETLDVTQTGSARFAAGIPGSPYYRVRGVPITRGCEEDTSDMLKIQVDGLLGLDITGAPETGACVGGVVTLNTSVTGGSITNYTWQVSSDASRWNTITGAKGSSYQAPTSAAGIRYYRVSGTSSCGVVTSKASMVSVNAGVKINGTPSLVEECTGGLAELSLNITGGSGQRQVQWMRSQSTTSGYSKLVGETSTQLLIDSIWSGNTYYQADVSDSGVGCGTGLRLATPILVKGLPNPVVRVSGPTGVVCTGQSTTLRAAVSGGKGSAIYQWERSVDGTNWEGLVNGGNNAQYIANTVDTGSYYYRVYVWMSEGNCSDAYSAPYKVRVVSGGTLDLSSAVDTVCLGGTIQLSASVGSGIQATSYQWQYQDIGSSVWNTLTGYTGSSISLISNTAIVRRYRVQGIISSACGTITSDTAVVVTVGKPVVRIAGPIAQVCKGSIVKLTTQVVGGAGIITYQWQEAASGSSTWRNIAGATASSYQPVTSIAGIKRYRVFVRASGVGCGSGVYSVNTISVTVLGSCTAARDIPGLLPGIIPIEQGSIKLQGLPWIALLQLRDMSRTTIAPQVGTPVTNALELNTASPALSVEPRTEAVRLYQNYPNPFSDVTRIGYYLPSGMDIRIVVEDIRGRQLYQEEGYKESGAHELILDRTKFRGSGVYVYRLETRTGGLVRKMLLVE